MSKLSLILPEVSKPSKTEDPKTDTAFTTIQNWANGEIDGNNVAATLTGRRLLDRQTGYFGAGTGNGTYVFEGTTMSLPGTENLGARALIRLESTDYAVTGKANTQLIIKGNVATNGTAPSSTFKFKLYVVASSGGAENKSAFTLGASVGETTALAAPAANSITGIESTAFAFPASNWYALVAEVSGGATAAKSVVVLNVQLFVLNS